MLWHICEILGTSFILVSSGTLLIRLSGKKSISELTIASTVVMFSIGELLAEPILSKSIWQTVVAMIGFLGTLALLEKLQLKWNRFERLLFGTPKVIVADGRVVEHQLKKLRLSVDDLEMRLREASVSRIADVKTATMEANGHIAVDLKPQARPVTVGDLERFLAEWQKAAGDAQTGSQSAGENGQSQLGGEPAGKPSSMSEDGDLFEEVRRSDAGQHVPKRLH